MMKTDEYQELLAKQESRHTQDIANAIKITQVSTLNELRKRINSHSADATSQEYALHEIDALLKELMEV